VRIPAADAENPLFAGSPPPGSARREIWRAPRVGDP